MDNVKITSNLYSIEDLCKELIKLYKSQQETIELAQKQNTQLMNGMWKEEKLAQCQVELVALRNCMKSGFYITEEEQKKIDVWKESLPKCDPTAIGGRFEYSFCPTSIGTIGKVNDVVSGEEFTFRELS
jgi:hypothetical protein